MRTKLILWLVLVGLFVGFYQYFSVRQGGQAPPASEASRAGFTMWATSLAVLAVLIGYVKFRTRWQKGNNEAVALLNQGRTVEALERFRDVAKKSDNPLPLFNIGVASLQLWRLDEAVRTLQAARKAQGKLIAGTGIHPHALQSLALAFALQGKLEESKQALAEGARLGSPLGPMTQLSSVVLAARSGDWPGAQALLNQHAMVLDQLGGPMRALADAVRALVASKVGGPGGSVDRVRLFRETSAEGLKQGWPELVEFVERVSAAPQVMA